MNDELTGVLPVLPTGDLVALPGLVIPLLVVEGPAHNALMFAVKNNLPVIIALGETEEEQVRGEELARTAVWARVITSTELPDESLKVRLHVEGRVHIEEIVEEKPCLKVKVSEVVVPTKIKVSKTVHKLIEESKENLRLLSEFDGSVDEYLYSVESSFDPGEISDLIAASLSLPPEDGLAILEEENGGKRLKLASSFLVQRLKMVSVAQQISGRANQEIKSAEREQILRLQLEMINQELGEAAGDEIELQEITERLSKKKLPKVARDEAEKQLRRLKKTHPDASEAGLLRTYLEWVIDLPWSKKTKDKLELERAKEILDEDHFGLKKTKERILDFLGVLKLKKNHRGPILLLNGPPGVGKTSLGKSIARALGREFVRVSVGGLRDEAELRGHRRTYVGALPGRIIQSLKRAGSKNPVFMLDELDKIGSDFRGDPASVLLEVLDPEQNKSFEDHYLNLPFDLSEVLFIGTSNMTDSIPPPLLDRMEVIEISGYTGPEKIEIVRRYLLDRAREANGLADYDIDCNEEAIKLLIRGYTKESGVRELSRVVSALYRKVARGYAEGGSLPEIITPEFVEKALGKRPYKSEFVLSKEEVGVVTGLAWTSVGGETLIVESAIMPGKGGLLLTGQQGEVMQESARAALTFVQEHAELFGIDPEVFEKSKLHVHLPQGAVPKDGPSAGIAIATAICSVLTGRPVSHKVAMTGEISLRGRVLEIGGLKEKSLAALRAGIETVIIPKGNEDDLEDFPAYLKERVNFRTVQNAVEVVEMALVGKTTNSKGVGAKVDGKPLPSRTGGGKRRNRKTVPADKIKPAKK